MKKNRFYEIENFHNHIKISDQRGLSRISPTWRRHRSNLFNEKRNLLEGDITRVSGILQRIAGGIAALDFGFRGLNALEQSEITREVDRAAVNKYSSFIQDIKSNPRSITKNIATCDENGSAEFNRTIDELSRNPNEIDDVLNPTTEEGFENLKKLYTAYLVLNKKCLEKNKKTSASINKINFNAMNKKADQYSNKYYQDAVKDSGNDAFMKTFYKEMSSEYEKKIEHKHAGRKDLMDFFYEQEHIMSQAHPNSTYVADAMGHGGLVENGVESHNIIKNIARKKTTGNNF